MNQAGRLSPSLSLVSLVSLVLLTLFLVLPAAAVRAHLWQNGAGGWKITRAISYDHASAVK